jgi:hypothetical protein
VNQEPPSTSAGFERSASGKLVLRSAASSGVMVGPEGPFRLYLP